MSAVSPVRFPDQRSLPTMTKRAWWLVVLNVLMPGSAQVLAGNRKLGRVGLVSTFVFWLLAIVTIVSAVAVHKVLFDVATNTALLSFVQVFLAYYAVLWLVLTIDTLRLVRFIRLAPLGRACVLALAIVVLAATAGPAAYGSYLSGVQHGLLDHLFSSKKAVAAPTDGRYNVLLLGGDAGADRTGLRPDSISVASIDAETGQTTIIGVPRNLYNAPFRKGSPLYGPFPNGYTCGDSCLVSFLYTYGMAHPELYPNAVKEGSNPGIEAERDAIEGVTGLTIPYYALIDMGGFVDLINALGGITVDVPYRIPIDGGQTASGQLFAVKGWIEPGVQHLDGYHALWFARARHGTDDYHRMARQRTVEQAVLAQFTPAKVLSKFQSVADAGTQIVKTDIPQGMLSEFVSLAVEARSQKMTDLELVPPTYDNLHPDFDKIRAAVKQATKVAPATK